MADKSYFITGTSDGFLGLYLVNGVDFTRIPNPDVVPVNGSPSFPLYGAAFSPNAEYMVVSSNVAPRLMFYKREGDSFTKLADPSILPENGNCRPSFSPDGNYLATNLTFQSGVMIYKRNGDSFEKLPDPSITPDPQTTCTSWNRDGTIVGFGRGASVLAPYFYFRSGDVFSKIPFATPALPQITTNDIVFSPVSNLVIVCSQSAPFITVSTVSFENHVRHSDPAVQPLSEAKSAAFNADGSLFFVGTQSNGLSIYSLDGVTLTKLNDVAGSPNQINTVRFNHDFTILSVAHTGGSGVVNYSVSGSTLTPLPSVPSLPSGSIDFGYFSGIVSKIPNPSVITVDKSSLIAMQNAVIYYNQNKPEGLTGGIDFPNQPGWMTPENQPWSRLSIAPMVSTNVAVGGGANWVRRSILIVIDVFTPKGSGVNTNLAICEEVINLFENTQFGNIKTFEANLAKIEDDPWLGYQVTINAYIEGY